MSKASSIVLRLPPALLQQVDLMAAAASISTSELLVELIDNALATEPARRESVNALPFALLRQIDLMAAAASISTSEMLVELVEKALAAAPARGDAGMIDDDLIEIRGEFMRLDRSLVDIQRQLSMLAIRTQAFSVSGSTEPASATDLQSDHDAAEALEITDSTPIRTDLCSDLARPSWSSGPDELTWAETEESTTLCAADDVDSSTNPSAQTPWAAPWQPPMRCEVPAKTIDDILNDFED